MTVSCTVVDARGKNVSGLKRDDFLVYDNDVPRKIENLWFDDDLPLTLGVIIDASESQRDQLTEHKDAAWRLIGRIGRPGDRVFTISAAEEVRLWGDSPATPADLRRQIDGPPGELLGLPCPRRQGISTCGASPLWNAIYDAARLRLAGLTGSKALLILTDGFDSGSTHTWLQAADQAHRADAIVYAIQYPSQFGGRYAPDLYRLVYETGGASFQDPRGDYRAIATRIDDDLRQRYVLGFRPEKLSGRFRHDVRVRAKREDLTVRAKKTYFPVPL